MSQHLGVAMVALRRVLLVTLMLVALLLMVPAAHAALDDAPGGTSSTNPDAPPHEWRQRWGNSLYPNFTLTSPADVDGFLYSVDRSADTTVNPANPDAYDRTVKSNGTHFDTTLDLDGIYLTQPTAWDGRLLFPGGAMLPQEGIWYWHLKAYAVNQAALSYEYAAANHTVDFGFDATPPAKVTGLGVFSSASAAAPAAVLTQSRANVRWNYTDYDTLAGTAYFQIYMDGKKAIPAEGDDPGDSPSGTPWYGTGGTGRVTIENLTAGKHTFNVSAVDRATNEGVKSSTVTVYVDPDVPTVAINVPSAGGTLGAKPTLRATAEDQAGIQLVAFYVDGVFKGNVAPGDPPTRLVASKTVDLSSLPNGTHTLVVKAYDIAGRVVQVSRAFRLDKTMPRLSSISGAPNPFYPRKRDGYKDNFKVKYRANKAGTLKMVIRNSKGTVVRTVSKRVSAGSGSISWNGKYNDGSVRKGTFRYRLTLTDGGGQRYTTSTRRVSIKFTQLVRVSSSSVRVVQR